MGEWEDRNKKPSINKHHAKVISQTCNPQSHNSAQILLFPLALILFSRPVPIHSPRGSSSPPAQTSIPHPHPHPHSYLHPHSHPPSNQTISHLFLSSQNYRTKADQRKKEETIIRSKQEGRKDFARPPAPKKKKEETRGEK